MAVLSPNFDISLEFGTGSTPSYNSMDAWVSSVTFAHNEPTNQYYPLGNNGVAFNSTTGIAPVLTCSGKRLVGDASQTAILAMQYSLGGSRKGSRELAGQLMEAARRHGAMMIMGSDAHIEFDVGNHAYAMELIEQYGFPEELIINSSPEKFKEWIAD